MKATIDRKNRVTTTGRSARRGRLTPLVRVSFVLAATAVLCLMTAGVAAASFTETGHQAAVAPEPGAVPQTFQEWKYGAHTIGGQVPTATHIERKVGAHTPGGLIETVPLIPAQPQGTSITPWVVGVSLAIAAAVVCATLLFLRRRRGAGRLAATAPAAVIRTDHSRPKAA